MVAKPVPEQRSVNPHDTELEIPPTGELHESQSAPDHPIRSNSAVNPPPRESKSFIRRSQEP